MSLKLPTGRTQPVARDVRVNLLPKEIAQAERAGAQRRLIVFLAIVSVIIVGLGTVAASFLAATAQSQLETEQARAQMLLSERAKYIEAQHVTGLILLTEDAQRAGAAADVDWVAFLNDIIRVTPAGVAVGGFDAENSTVTIPSSGPQGPLEGPRLGQVQLVSQTVDNTLIVQWVAGLKTLDGYLGSTVHRVENTESDAGYTLAVTLYFDNERLRDRYPLEGADGSTTDDVSADDDVEGDEG